MKSSTTLFYTNIVHAVMALFMIIAVFVERNRYKQYSHGIKAMLVGLGLLAVSPLLALLEGGIFTPKYLLSLYGMNTSEQFGAYRMVGVAYLALLYGAETCAMVALNKRATRQERTEEPPNKAL